MKTMSRHLHWTVNPPRINPSRLSPKVCISPLGTSLNPRGNPKERTAGPEYSPLYIYILGKMILLNGAYDFVICTYRFIQMQHRRLLKYMEFMELPSEIGVDAAKAKTNRMHWQRPVLSLFSDIYNDLGFKIRHLILDEVRLGFRVRMSFTMMRV